MESPETWNLLTACLAVMDLAKPERTWSFLVQQQVARDADDAKQAFLQFLREEEAVGPITGPSLPARVASRLTSSGFALPAGRAPDAWGNQAQALANGWLPDDDAMA